MAARVQGGPGGLAELLAELHESRDSQDAFDDDTLGGVRRRSLPTAKTHLQNVFSAMAINVGLLGAHFDAESTTRRRPTQVHELCLTSDLEAV